MHPRFTLATIAVASAFSSPALATTPHDDGLIVVTATRQATRHSEVLSDSSVITRQEIERMSPLQTIGDLLANESGIETVTTGAPGAVTNIFIRGANGGHTLLLIDGMRVGSATLGEAGFSRLPLSQIERVEILRGPASGLYGSDAIGGVIQVFTRPTIDGTQLSAGASVGSFNTREADAGIATRIGGASGSLRVGTVKSDGFNAIHDRSNRGFNADDDGYKNTNLSASLGYAFNTDHELGASLLHSKGENQYDGRYFDSSFPFAGHADYNFRTRHKIDSLSAYSNNRLNAFWSSKIMLGRSVDDSLNFDEPNHHSLFKTEQRQLSWQNDIRLAAGKLLLAAERLEQEIDASSSYVLKERDIDSLLAGWTTSFGRHRLQANVRRDRNSQFGTKTTGNLGFGVQLSDTWRVRTAAGSAFKAPTFNDLYFPQQAFVGGGNPNLNPERARSAEFGLHRETSTGNIALTAFHSTIKDLISWQPDDPTFVSSFEWHPVNLGKVRLRGLSLSGKQSYGSLSVRAGYDTLDHEDTGTGKELTLRARHRGNVGIEQQLGKTTIGAEMQAVGRRFNDSENRVRLAGYTLVNLQLEHKLGNGLFLQAKANNLFDKAYEVRDDYATGGRSVFVGVRYSSR